MMPTVDAYAKEVLTDGPVGYWRLNERSHDEQVCHQKFSLGVPFTQRFWELAIRQRERVNPGSEQISTAAGYVGMITANSFMKREFGKKLIEEFFPKTDLTHVLDTSGAYIPGVQSMRPAASVLGDWLEAARDFELDSGSQSIANSQSD